MRDQEPTPAAEDDLERRFMANEALQAQLADARAHPERSVPRPPRRHLARSDEEHAELMAEIEKGQQLAGNFPNDEALDRAERVLSGETTYEDAKAELRAKYPVVEEDQS